MESAVLPVLLFAVIAVFMAVAMVALGTLLGPKRKGQVKQMPYESGMDPIHDARRRFDVRFYLVAIAFLIFDVELLFLYPWAVASRNPEGIDQVTASAASGAADSAALVSDRGVVFGAVMFFLALVALGLVYDWRKGVLRWR